MLRVFLFLAVVLAVVFATSPHISGTNPLVIDGDTIILDKKRLRLYGIDAPELGQQGYAEAKARLTHLTRGKVSCTLLHEDKYGRYVAYCPQVEVLLEECLVMPYPFYQNKCHYPFESPTAWRQRHDTNS